MDIQITPNTSVAAPTSLSAAQQPPPDTKVPVVQRVEGRASLPPEHPFVAQVINARLSGEEFPESPGEIAPPERTLRPYDVPMLPADKSDDIIAATQADQADPGPLNETD